MFQLKTLARSSIPAALAKAQHYRLLNEPHEAESICRDVLEVEPSHHEALTTLVLALTDQFATRLSARVREAKALTARLGGDYERAYYSGVICERAAKVHHRRGTAASGPIAYDLLRQAMAHYEAAERQCPPGNDDALLRWNTCARLLMRSPELRPGDEDESVHLQE